MNKGISKIQKKEIGEFIGIKKTEALKSLENILDGLFKCFMEKNAILIEINPLVMTVDGELKVCDTKIKIDDNAVYKQKDLFE